MWNPAFTPKLFTLLKAGISRAQFSKDLLSGLTVGIVALPLAIAFGIASGVSPEVGLVSAVVGGFLISLLGGSRVQIGGPTGAFIILVYSVVADHGIEGLIIATFLAGLLLIVLGFARFGSLLKYVPHPLIVGFTSGIAVIIFSSQIKDLLGLQIDKQPADFIHKWQLIFSSLSGVNLFAIVIGVSTILIILLSPRITSKIPGAFMAILMTAIAVHVFALPVATIGSTFGEIKASFPAPSFPVLSLEKVRSLFQPALAIALLGGIESLLSATVADGMIGGRHRSNMELVGQGVANSVSALFGGIPVTGAIARTATNVKNGGRTPIAGMTHAVVLLLILLFLGPYAGFIPMSCLAGILIVVAYHMSEWRQFVRLLKSNSMEVLILITTFLLTVFFDLIIAIEVGIVLSSFILMRRMSQATTITDRGAVSQDLPADDITFENEHLQLPTGVLLYEIQGPLFFGAAQTFQDTLSRVEKLPKVLIIRMRYVPFIDSTGALRLNQVIRHFQERKTTVIISGVSPNLYHDLEDSNTVELVGPEHITSNIQEALKLAGNWVDVRSEL